MLRWAKILKEMREERRQVRQDALVTRLTLVATAPWKVHIPGQSVHASIAIWSIKVDAFSARLRQATSVEAWMQDYKCSYTRLAILTWYAANHTRSNRS